MRCGSAFSFLRCEDKATADEIMARDTFATVLFALARRGAAAAERDLMKRQSLEEAVG